MILWCVLYLAVYSCGPTDEASSEKGRLLFLVVAEWNRCAEFPCYHPRVKVCSASVVVYPNCVAGTELLRTDSTSVVVAAVVDDGALLRFGNCANLELDNGDDAAVVKADVAAAGAAPLMTIWPLIMSH